MTFIPVHLPATAEQPTEVIVEFSNISRSNDSRKSVEHYSSLMG